MSIYLRYLGTSDSFDEGDHLLERNGDPVELDDDRAQYLQGIPGEMFEEVDAEEAQKIQQEREDEERAAEERKQAEEAAQAEHDEQAQREADARGGYYGAQSQEEADAAVLRDVPPDEDEEGAEASGPGEENPQPADDTSDYNEFDFSTPDPDKGAEE